MSERFVGGVLQAGVTIVECGAEGGSVSIQGRRDEDGRWVFWCVTDESSMAALLPDESFGAELSHRSEEVGTWAAALQAIGRYPWRRLYPMVVHPEFADAVLQAVLAEGETDIETHQVDLWCELCREAGPRSSERGGQW